MTRKELIKFCLTFPGAYEDYPFDESWAVMRHSGNKKSFAFIYMNDDKVFVNLKCEPLEADFLRSVFKDVTPGYHMNKQHWNTVMFGSDSDVPDDALRNMVEQSYNLIKPKLKRKKADEWES